MLFAKGGFLQFLIGFRGDIAEDLLDGAVEDAAQIVEGGSAQRFVLPQPVDGGGGNVMILDEGIGGFSGFLQRLPKGGVNQHSDTPFPCVCF